MMMTVVALGDSVLKGVINTDGHYSVSPVSFAHLCEENLGIQVINKAMMGATVTKGRQVLERALKTAADPSVSHVFLEFGGNDCDYDWSAVSEDPALDPGPRTSPEDFKAGYVNLIDRLREIGKEPVILSLPPIDSGKYFSWITRNLNAENVLSFLGGKVSYLGDWHESYNLEVFKIALECSVKLIDITSCFLRTKNYADLFCIDGIHPNEKGHALIAEEICRYFA